MELTDRPLSFTQINDYLTCRHRWYLKYVLGVRPRQRARPLELGDAVHGALAAFLEGGSAVDYLTRWELEAKNAQPIDDPSVDAYIEKLVADARTIVDRAFAGLVDLGYWTYLDKNSGRPFVETTLAVPLDEWAAGLETRLDWIAYDPTNKTIWVVDFKTRGYFTNDVDEWANLQNVIHQAAALHRGIESIGTLTFQIQSNPPKLPKLNKAKADGTVEMSRAAVACDWHTYRSELLRHGLDPTDYLDMLPKLDKEYIRVTPVIRSVATVQRAWNEIIVPLAREMALAYNRLSNDVENTAPRNLSPRVCNSCGQRPICHGTLDGRSVRALLDSDFDHKPQALTALGW